MPMSLVDAFAAEFRQESATTRRVLERVPEDRMAWKPHEKSMTLSRLAGHTAELPRWGTMTLRAEEFDLARAAEQGFKAAQPTTSAELLADFEQVAAEFLEAARDVPDEHALGPWTLRHGERKVFTLPRIAVLRSFVLGHVVHHRGQLSVYLRLLDVPVPSIYGPSADEGSL